MYLLKVFLTILLVTSALQAREIKITVSDLGTTGQMVDTREIINLKERIYIQEVSVVDKNDPKTMLKPELASEAFRKVKEIGEWKDLYELTQVALKKNIIQGTAVDYFEHNNERFQRTLKWEGKDEFNFSLTIKIEKQ